MIIGRVDMSANVNLDVLIVSGMNERWEWSCLWILDPDGTIIEGKHDSRSTFSEQQASAGQD